jgi:tetratricopeptide (TPR) repeat protein
VDSLLCNKPAEALELLKQDESIANASEDDQARYCLLYVQATDKCELSLIPCGSLIDFALEVYQDGPERGKALFYKARILTELNMSQDAMEHYFKALTLFGMDDHDIRYRGMIYEDLGGVNHNQSLFQKAIGYYETAYNIYQSINDQKSMAIALTNKGLSLMMLKEKETALATEWQSLKCATRSKDSATIFVVCHNIGMLYSRFNELDSALIYAKKALRYNTLSNKDIALQQYEIGNIYSQKNQSDSALYYTTIALENGNIVTQALSHNNLADMEEKRGNHKKALMHLKKYAHIIDSVYVNDKSGEIGQLGCQYEAESVIQQHRAQTKFLIIFIVFAALIIILILIIVVQQVRRKKEKARLLHEQREINLRNKMNMLEEHIDQNRQIIGLLQQEQQEREEEIKQKEEELQELILKKSQYLNMLFKQAPVYKKIEKLSNQPLQDKKEIQVLTTKEQEKLKKDIFYIYNAYIQYLWEQYPQLTDDDMVFLCLRSLDLDTFTIARCFGNFNRQVASQREYRIRQKMGLTK